ncbi:hypothetical protein, partial [Streptomyces sp. NPDC056160]|uniref:hypothetical protein n=1 Tax=Streptomyces sp. NPDC056160 TaxID=3345731 RepID=UPI0035D672E8
MKWQVTVLVGFRAPVLALVARGSLPCRSSMVDLQVLERIAARRAELDSLEEQLVKQLDQVRAERDELAVAERAPARMSEQIAGERAAVVPASAQVGGRCCRRSFFRLLLIRWPILRRGIRYELCVGRLSR